MTVSILVAQAMGAGEIHIIKTIVIMGITNVTASTLRARDVVILPMIFSLLPVFGVELPLAYFLNAHVGLDGIWWAYADTFIFNFLLFLLYYQFYQRRQLLTCLV